MCLLCAKLPSAHFSLLNLFCLLGANLSQGSLQNLNRSLHVHTHISKKNSIDTLPFPWQPKITTHIHTHKNSHQPYTVVVAFTRYIVLEHVTYVHRYVFPL